MGRQRQNVVKSKFSQFEDAQLRHVIARGICRDWSEVAREIPGRNARQCRERWNNYVNPDLSRAKWTDEEERLLIRQYQEHGSKWQVIAKSFPHRSKNQIKNRWFAYQRRTKNGQWVFPHTRETPATPFDLPESEDVFTVEDSGCCFSVHDFGCTSD
jgi:hypothetical protein